jgi:hypothetical protein
MESFIEPTEEGISFDEWESYNRLIKYFGNLRPEWGKDGLCYQTHPTPDYNPWFPEHGKHKLLRHVQKECAVCPVREQCFESGWDDEYGVWGGSSEKQRRDWKKDGVALEEARVLLRTHLEKVA